MAQKLKPGEVHPSSSHGKKYLMLHQLNLQAPRDLGGPKCPEGKMMAVLPRKPQHSLSTVCGGGEGGLMEELAEEEREVRVVLGKEGLILMGP